MIEHVVPVRVYYVIFGWLMALLVVTLVAAYLPLGGWGTLVAFTIATVKAVLILLYFMHVRYGSRLIWIAATAAFLWLGILLVLTLSDYEARGWTPASEMLRPDRPADIPPPPKL